MRDERLQSVAATVIEEILSTLPSSLHEAAQRCRIESVFMRDHAIETEALEEDLLGLFEGSSLADDAEHLPRIRLFLDNLWDYAEGDLDRFREEVRITLLHELGHYLGFDEDQVADRGLE